MGAVGEMDGSSMWVQWIGAGDVGGWSMRLQ